VISDREKGAEYCFSYWRQTFPQQKFSTKQKFGA